MMVDINDTSDAIHLGVIKILDELNYQFVDESNTNNTNKVFCFSLHSNEHEVFPNSKLNSFLMQIKDNLNAYTTLRQVTCLEINGPIVIQQTCFLNKTYHPHYLWDITIAF